MDPIGLEAIKTAAFTILGVLFQAARAQKSVPNAVAWLGLGVACIGAYIWATPAWMAMDWRVSLLALYGFVMAARGAASTSKDVGAMPASNTK